MRILLYNYTQLTQRNSVSKINNKKKNKEKKASLAVYGSTYL